MHRPLASALVVALLVTAASACSREVPIRTTTDVTFATSAVTGAPLAADVYEPVERSAILGGDGVGLPAVVLVHGGGWEQGSRADVAGTAEGLARAGFVAVAVDYGLGAPGQRFTGQVRDVQAAVRWVQQQADQLGADPTRVGVYGSSAGGNLAMMVGVWGQGDDSLPPVRAVASWSGISDLAVLSSPDGGSHPEAPPPGCTDGPDTCVGVLTPWIFPDYVGCTLSACPARFAEASPITHVGPATPPMYLTAADVDFVPFDQAVRMADALAAAGVEAEAVAVPDGVHAEGLRDEALEPTVEFFRRHLSRVATGATATTR